MTDQNDQNTLIAPESLIKDHPKAQRCIQNGDMWCLLINLTKQSEVPRQGAGLFRERDYHGLTDIMNNTRDHLHETEVLCLFVRSAALEDSVKKIRHGFENQVNHPYGPFFGDHPTNPFLELDQLNVSPPKVKSQATLSFHDIDEYIVKTGYGTVLENSLEQKSIGAGDALPCNVVTVLPPGVPTDNPLNELLGFLTTPEGYSIPQPGETFPLLLSKLNVTEKHHLNPSQLANAYPWKNGWRCTVLTPGPFAPDSTVMIHMRRAFDKDTDKPVILEKDYEPRPLIPKANDPKFDLQNALSNEQARGCWIKRSQTQNPYKQQIAASFGLVNRGQFIHPTLLANDTMSLTEVNAYRTIASENLVEYANRVKADGSMNKEQLTVFEKFQVLRGWIGVVQGPSGTGKTYTLARCVLPFLLYPKEELNPDKHPKAPAPKETPKGTRTKIPAIKRTRIDRHQVLLLAPTNAAADYLAQSLHEMIEKHSGEFDSGKPKVVRVYPINAEKDSYHNPSAEWTDESTATNTDVEQALQSERVYKLFMDHYLENKPSDKLTRYSASRITLQRLSLGNQTIEFARNDERWKPWLRQRSDLAMEDLDGQQKATYFAWGKYMMQQVLADADIVVCTLFSAGQKIIREAISPDAVFIDEAAMTKETDLWPIYAWYSRVPLLLFGDHHQMQPFVKSTPETNQFHRQLQVSPFTRFVYAGLLVEVLREQYRMAPDISAIVNRIFYANEVRDAMKVTLPHNQMAQRILEWNRTGRISCNSNAVFLDVRGASAEKIGFSTVNYTFAEHGIALCRELLSIVSPKDIAIITPYEAQYRLYQRLLLKAHLQWPEHGFKHVNVWKLDSSQGKERSVVIFDVTFTERIGFMAVPSRWNVALSRACDGMYVLCDRSGIRKQGCRTYCIGELLRIADGRKLWVGSERLVAKRKRREMGG